MTKRLLSVLFAALLLGVMGMFGCGDDEDDAKGICFWECDGQSSTASAEGVTEDECHDTAEADEWCTDLGEVIFEAGCDECESCAPDWYEC